MHRKLDGAIFAASIDERPGDIGGAVESEFESRTSLGTNCGWPTFLFIIDLDQHREHVQ